MNSTIPWKFSPDRGQPLVPQIKSHLITLIHGGYLGAGQKILTIEGFAALIGVNKKTVEAAYKALAAQKLLEIRRPLGYFVSGYIPMRISSAQSPLAAFPFIEPEPVFDPKRCDLPYLSLGSESSGLVPGSLEKHLREYRKAHRVFHQIPGCKSKALINYAISQILNYRGMHAEDNQFQIIHGLERNLYIVVLSLLKQHSCVAMASREDVRAIAAFHLVKADICFTGSDQEGMLVDELEKICLRQQVKVVFVRPAATYPYGLPLSEVRRKQLMELADRHQFVIIEMYSEHEFWPGPEPLTFWETYRKDRVIYLSPVSRMSYPLSSMGLVVGPQDFVNSVRSLGKQYTVIDRISELQLANMVQEGTYCFFLDDMQKDYRRLSLAITFILDNYLSELATYTMPTAGCTVWVELHEKFDPGRVLPELEELGLYAPGTSAGYYSGQAVKALMIGFASPSIEKLESGIKLIARAIREELIACAEF